MTQGALKEVQMRGDQAIAMVPADLYSRHLVLGRPAEKQVIGRLTLAAHQEANLDNIMPLISATNSSVALTGEAKIDENKQPVEVEITRDGIKLSFQKAAPFNQKRVETEIEKMKGEFAAGEKRWREIIGKAQSGDLASLQRVVGGIWGVQLLDMRGDLLIDKNWKQTFFKDDVFGEWFITSIATNPRVLGRHHARDLNDSKSFHRVSKVITQNFSRQDYEKGIPMSSTKIMTALYEAVQYEYEDSFHASGDSGLLLPMYQREYASQISQALDNLTASSTPANILKEKSALLGAAAVEDRDFPRIIAESAHSLAIEGIEYDASKSQIVFKTTAEGITYTTQVLQRLLDSAAKQVHVDLGISIAPEIKVGEKEDNLVPFTEILEKARGITIPPLVKANMALQLEKGFVYQWFIGARGTGKTTSAANFGLILQDRLRSENPQSALPILRPRTASPEGVLAAMRETMWRLVMGKPTFLLVDESHRVFDGRLTEDQAVQLLTLQSIVNIWGESGNVPIGGIIFAGEKDLKDIKLKETGRNIGFGAGGEAHRFPTQEMILWNGEREHDAEFLSKLVTNEASLTGLPKEQMDLVTTRILDRIVAAADEGRRYIAPSFIR